MSRSRTEARIEVSQDGPYLATGHIPLAEQVIVSDAEGGSEAWKEGASFPVQEKYALCRCGQSKKKPFCDGTHTKIGFDGTETASREPYLDQAQAFDGPSLALLDVESLCAFGRFCDPRGKVWNQVSRTDDPKVRSMFIRQVENCPAGRLVAFDKASEKPIEPKLPVSIGLIEDPAEQCSGPLWLRGGIMLVSADGFEYEVRNRMTICRCGASRNKPFCDGTHAAIKFHAK
ncbi:MAG TPA: CDGSH iron-sulfur domain-containing protein [Xanthobacteraceae bacterium]|jgi:CDGSH-type Zn-finger protein|nr:CDGSH iron-sulfur domain-containing protein [Xanthobacteraceae bacterium]